MEKKDKSKDKDKKKKKDRLTDMQKIFVEEYLVDRNATQACLRAGYAKKNPKNADKIGPELLGLPWVAAAIEAATQKRLHRVTIKQDYVLESIKEVAERCMQKVPVVNNKGRQVLDEHGNAVWKFDSSGALKALELLGRHLGMFKDLPAQNMNNIFVANEQTTVYQMVLETVRSTAKELRGGSNNGGPEALDVEAVVVGDSLGSGGGNGSSNEKKDNNNNNNDDDDDD